MKPILLAAIAAIAVAAPPARAAEAPADAPVQSEAEALDQLEAAAEALAAEDPREAHPTEELRRLVAALPYLRGADRRRAKALLARPPANSNGGYNDGGSFEPFGAEWNPAATATRQHYDSPGGRFRIHWVTTAPHRPPLADSGGVPGVPDYVELVAAYADQSADVENGGLGWPDPKPDGTRGGDGRTDVYLSQLCPRGGPCVFGYASPDAGQEPGCNTAPFRCAAYLVLDNDYAEFGYKQPDIPLQVTVAHEYNHVLQFAIDAVQDTWLFESTATWVEEQVFPDANDWLFYANKWAKRPGLPITAAAAGGGLRVYGTAVWNHWLERGGPYGPEVVLGAWQRSHDSDPKHFAVGAYDLAIRDRGGRGFSQEFARFAAATAEWRVLDGNFPDERFLPDVDRQGTLRPGARAKRFRLPHTAYRLFRIKPGKAERVRLRVRAARGVRTGVALVARDGSRTGGAIAEEIAFLPKGGRVAIRLPEAGIYERITAVVANADGRVRGFRGGEWRYTRDRKRFRVSVGGS